MSKPLRQLSLAFVVALLLPAAAPAQYDIPNDVVGNGGEESSSTNFGIRGTVGQPALGATTAGSYIVESGYWYGPGTVVTAIGDRDGEPAYQNRLRQNHPNPFNPTTTIQFELAERAHARIAVYDVAGRLVTMLVDRELDPGVHSVTFNAGGLASGVYFYRIEAGPFSDVKKLVLLK
jgi:hypothetical protein